MKHFIIAVLLLCQSEVFLQAQQAEQISNQTYTVEHDLLKAQILMYEVLLELQEYDDITSWDDLKSFAVHLFNVHDEMKQIFVEMCETEDFKRLHIASVESYFEFVGQLGAMQVILTEFAAAWQHVQREIVRLQDEQTFESWNSVLDKAELHFISNEELQSDDPFYNLSCALTRLTAIQKYWNDQVDVGNAVFLQ